MSRLIRYSTLFCVKYVFSVMRYCIQFCVKYVSWLMRYSIPFCVNYVTRMMRYIIQFCVMYVPDWWVTIRSSVLSMCPEWWVYRTQFFFKYVSRLMRYSTQFYVMSCCNSVQVCFVVGNITVVSCQECVAVATRCNISHSPVTQQCIITYHKQMCCQNLTYCNIHIIFC